MEKWKETKSVFCQFYFWWIYYNGITMAILVISWQFNWWYDVEFRTYLRGLISMAISSESAIFLAKWQQNENSIMSLFLVSFVFKKPTYFSLMTIFLFLFGDFLWFSCLVQCTRLFSACNMHSLKLAVELLKPDLWYDYHFVLGWICYDCVVLSLRRGCKI